LSCSSGEERSGINGTNIGALPNEMAWLGCGDLMGVVGEGMGVGEDEDEAEEEDEEERYG